MSAVRSLKARMMLGLQLCKNVLLRPVAGDRGPGPWLQRLRQESLGPVPEGAWEQFPGASRCIACGLCDFLPPVDRAGAAATVMGAGRQPADAPIELHRAERLRVFAADLSRICPARVSAEAIAELISRNAQTLA